MTEPAVGASTCASGSQVWKGKSGTLMKNARPKAQNIHICACGVRISEPVRMASVIFGMSKVKVPVAWPCA